VKKFAQEPLLPTKVELEKFSSSSAKISFYPFQDGYAVTLAHPLRRLLISSSVGYSPIAVKIEGADHEFDSIRGMLEDVVIFIINLKKLNFKIKDDREQIEIKYSFANAREITGGDLINDDIDVINTDQHLATINSDCNLSFSVVIQKGIGYVPSEEIRDMIPKDYIPIDAFFTPVTRATYDIEKMLVEDDPNYEKIVFEINTNGQIDPIDAFKEAVTVMKNQVSVFNKVFHLSDVKIAESEVEDTGTNLKDLLVKIEHLSLSARSFNSLDRLDIKYVGELALMSEVEIKNIKNLGKKSLDEISSELEALGYPIDCTLPENVQAQLIKKLEQLK
jgi:DNA-directed RNA polymerase subunit alpha